MVLLWATWPIRTLAILFGLVDVAAATAMVFTIGGLEIDVRGRGADVGRAVVDGIACAGIIKQLPTEPGGVCRALRAGRDHGGHLIQREVGGRSRQSG